MIERLVALKFPPGLQNSGTTYQSKGRWHVGNCIRFYEGNVEPIGGWVQRTTSGATISGTPNAAISWQTNDGVSYLAIGTSSGLYVVNSANVVYNISPVYVGTETTYGWQLVNYGAYLIAIINHTNLDTVTTSSTIYYWTGDIATVAQPIGSFGFGFRTVPEIGFGVVATPERFLVMLRGADPEPTGLTPYPVPPNRVN